MDGWRRSVHQDQDKDAECEVGESTGSRLGRDEPIAPVRAGPELDQSCLFRTYFYPELGQPFPELLQEPFGGRPVLKPARTEADCT